jgi:hypothetical protein
MVQQGPHAPAPPPLSPQTVHLVRTAQVNTLTLSQMADQKAQILMGASFVVFSLVVTEVGARAISWSMLCLAATAFLSSICAVAAILPRPGPNRIAESDYNPLFFGHFALMDEGRWTEGMLAEFRADEALYRMMLRDLYQNGVVLRQRKYRFLAWAYGIFLGGLALTLLVFLGEAAGLVPGAAA